MFLLRWFSTFLAFPVGGLVAVYTAGSVDGPVSGALAGLVAGVIIGGAQWLALRSHGIGPRWIVATAVGMAVGTALAASLTDSGTTSTALTLTGLVAGASVGILQGITLDRGTFVAAGWTAVVTLSWGVAWLVTTQVIVDADRGYVTFGASGSLVATLLTGLTLLWVVSVVPHGTSVTAESNYLEAEVEGVR